MNVSKRGLSWPDFEGGFAEVEDYIVKRVTDANVVTEFVRTKGIAVQAGGHIGLFPLQLAKFFGFVHTFEPIPEMLECLRLNTAGQYNVLVDHYALGATEGSIFMEPRRSGRSRVAPSTQDGAFKVPMTTIDAQKLVRCDLIYLDIEGYELDALKGAVATIAKYRPVIALEVLKNPGQYDAVNQWAKENNYYLAKRVHSDWIFTP
jgi:FkbM family methyltransferase